MSQPQPTWLPKPERLEASLESQFSKVAQGLYQPLPRRVIWVLAVVITVVHIGPEAVAPYVAGCDEMQMLEPGWRLARGNGFVGLAAIHQPPGGGPGGRPVDLANPPLGPVTTWPTTYGLIFGGLVALSGDAPTATWGLVGLKAAASLLGLVGWLTLAGRVLPAPGGLLLTLALAGNYYGISPLGGVEIVGPSHLFFWAVMPWWLDAAVEAMGQGVARLGQHPVAPEVHADAGFPTAALSYWPWLRIGLLAALAVQIRYQAVYLLPAGVTLAGLWALGWHYRPAAARATDDSAPQSSTLWRPPWRAGLIAAVLAGLPGALSFGVSVAVNVALGLKGFWIVGKTEAPANAEAINWAFLWHHNLLWVWGGFGLGLVESLPRIKPSLKRPESAESMLTILSVWAAVLATAAAAGTLALRRGLELGDSYGRDGSAMPTKPVVNASPYPAAPAVAELATVTAVMLAWLCLTLLAAAVRTPPSAGFAPTNDIRYYSEAIPAAGLVVLALLAGGLQRWPALSVAWCLTMAAVVGSVAGASLGVFLEARGSYRTLRDALTTPADQRPTPLERRVEELVTAQPLERHIVLDNLEGLPRRMMWCDGPRILSFSGGETPEQLSVSQPTFVVIIERWCHTRRGHLEPSWRTPRAQQYIALLLGAQARPVAALEDQGDWCRVFAGRVEPFAAGQRPIPPLPPMQSIPMPQDHTR